MENKNNWKFITRQTIETSQGYWIGHQMLGDVIGFCAAAHMLSVKTKNTIKVWFDPSRKNLVKYFTGLEWVERASIPEAINCGVDPILEEWPSMNGVKRFYKWMDPTLENPKSFDIHFKIKKYPSSSNVIGLITHSNTQGDIDVITLNRMVADAKNKFPGSRIAAIGNCDNILMPCGVEDWRQPNGDIDQVIEMVRKLDLLLTPQSGPCFIAAGFMIPMWVYRSKEEFWDYTLNYDEYKVDKWYDRPK